MGVGSGFAIAASLYCRDHEPNKRVVCIQGDSAFGFGGMEIETAFRYNLPVIFVIFNNNGIYGGMDKETFNEIKESGDPALRLVIKSTQIESINNLIAPQLSLPPMSLTANIRYEKLASAFDNFQGYFAETKEQIKDAFQKALKETKRPSIINIAINPSADRKAQVILRDLFFNLFSFF